MYPAIFLYGFLLLPQLVTQNGTVVKPETDCGPYVVAALEHELYGGNLNRVQLSLELNCDLEGFCSLGDIARYLEGENYRVTLSSTESPPSGRFAIAAMYADSGSVARYHFLLLEKNSDSSYIVFSPPSWTFEKQWENLRMVLFPTLLNVGSKGTKLILKLIPLVLIVSIICVTLLFSSRMRSIVGFALVASLIACHDNQDTSDMTIASTSQPLSIDLGTELFIDDIVRSHTVRILNQSGETVTIKDAKTSCGCTVANLAPGTEIDGGMDVSFDLNFNLKAGQSRSVILMIQYSSQGYLKHKFQITSLETRGLTYSRNFSLGEIIIGNTARINGFLELSRKLADKYDMKTNDVVRFVSNWGYVPLQPSLLALSKDGELRSEFVGEVKAFSPGAKDLILVLSVGNWNLESHVSFVGVQPFEIVSGRRILDKHGIASFDLRCLLGTIQDISSKDGLVKYTYDDSDAVYSITFASRVESELMQLTVNTVKGREFVVGIAR